MAETQMHVDVAPPAAEGDERTTLLGFLDYLRGAVVAKAKGVDEGAARTPGVASGTSLLGLVKHLTAAERYWFGWAFEGEDIPHPTFGLDGSVGR